MSVLSAVILLFIQALEWRKKGRELSKEKRNSIAAFQNVAYEIWLIYESESNSPWNLAIVEC